MQQTCEICNRLSDFDTTGAYTCQVFYFLFEYDKSENRIFHAFVLRHIAGKRNTDRRIRPTLSFHRVGILISGNILYILTEI
jgi:hypothetical protein